MVENTQKAEEANVWHFLDLFHATQTPEWPTLLKTSTDETLLQQISNIIETNHSSEICDSICEAVFHLVSMGTTVSEEEGCSGSDIEECLVFGLQFVPSLLWAYYSLLSRQVKWSCSKVEAILLAVYNQVATASSDTVHRKAFRIPALSKPSIYHEPSTGVSSILTEHALSQHEKSDKLIPIRSATKILDRISAGTRSSVIKANITKYNEYLSCYAESSLQCYCRTAMRLSACGYPPLDVSASNEDLLVDSLKALAVYPRVQLNGEVIKEIVTSLHFIAYNGNTKLAAKALRYLHRKSCYSLCPAAMLVTNAVQDILKLATSSEHKFEHAAPINPHNTSYRGAKDFKSAKQKKYHQTGSTSSAISASASPRRPDKTLGGRGAIESALTNISPVTLLDSMLLPSVSEVSHTSEMSGQDVTAETTQSTMVESDTSNVNEHIPSAQRGTGAEDERDLAMQPPPKIVVDSHDSSYEGSSSSDSTPLMSVEKPCSSSDVTVRFIERDITVRLPEGVNKAQAPSDCRLSEEGGQLYTFSPLENGISVGDGETDEDVFDDTKF